MTTLNRQLRSHQIEVLAKLLELVKRAGVERPVLLKGLGVGLNYPDPTLRQNGDIDLYVGEKYFEQVRAFISSELGLTASKPDADHHFSIKFMETNIEIHKYATYPDSIPYRSSEFIEWVKRELEGDKLREVSIEGVQVYLPPHNFDFIFIFFHTWRHFLMGGVGFRQFCDWICYINTFSDKFEQQELKEIVSKYRLGKVISLFATIAVKDLGLSVDKFPNFVATSEKSRKIALRKIWDGGNFGSNNVDGNQDRAYLIRKTVSLYRIIHSAVFIMSIDAGYVFLFNLQRVKNGFQKVSKGE